MIVDERAIHDAIEINDGDVKQSAGAEMRVIVKRIQRKCDD